MCKSYLFHLRNSDVYILEDLIFNENAFIAFNRFSKKRVCNLRWNIYKNLVFRNKKIYAYTMKLAFNEVSSLLLKTS